MKKILVTGGTVFVSKYTAEYFANHGYEVYVLNRNTRPQPEHVTVIEADRHALGEQLKGIYFDAVLDITSYNETDVRDLVTALGSFGTYILISSSAVYPETEPQPFVEDGLRAVNRFWGAYGTDKIAAENALLELVPDAYILRPPYLYGAMNNVYREAFVFDCAMADRPFYLPGDGSMKLQFFHVKDLCRFMELILEKQPEMHIFNVGNKEAVSIRDWAKLCYRCAGKQAEFVNVYADIEQRTYFSFYNYEYYLDVSRQYELMPDVMELQDGLQEAYDWYQAHAEEVRKKPYIEYIEEHLKNRIS